MSSNLKKKVSVEQSSTAGTPIRRKNKAPLEDTNAKIERLNKNDKPPLQELKKLNVEELKSLLRKKGLTVSGRKAELLERLNIGWNKTGIKVKACQHSEAKKKLKRALLDPDSPIHNMSLEEIRKSESIYSQYPNFEKYFKDLKKHVEEEKKQVQQDDIAAETHIKNNPRSQLNQRGYPHWDTHAAKALLEVDVANEMHQNMKPSQLRATRNAYKEFPPDVFAKRVNREISKQTAAAFWAHKRNKRGMKKYLKEITTREQN